MTEAPMIRTRQATLAVATFTLLLLTGCDAGPGADTDGAATAGASAGEPVQFASIDRSGVSGTAEAEFEDDEVEVSIALEGLTAGEVYRASLHEGRCAAGGAMVASIGEVTASSGGAGELERDVAGIDLAADEPAFIQVEDAGGQAVACADLPDANPSEMPLTDRADTASAVPPGAPRNPADTADSAGTGGTNAPADSIAEPAR